MPAGRSFIIVNIIHDLGFISGGPMTKCEYLTHSHLLVGRIRVHNLIKVIRPWLVLALLLMCFPLGALANWGREVGRATDGDVVRLLSDWTSMKMAEKRIADAVRNPLAKERQRQLLGLAPDAEIKADILLADVYDWWLKEVMTPVQRIALNRAASCAQATMAVQKYLGMMRQQALLGIQLDAARQAQFLNILGANQEMAFQRCRDEALDECTATGRYLQIIQTAFAQNRAVEIAGIGGISDSHDWALDSLRKCAIYDLHFLSTAKIDDGKGMMVERVFDGTVRIKIKGDDLLAMNGDEPALGIELYGETEGGVGLVSVQCTMPHMNVVCSRGKDIEHGFKAWIREMDMKHREFYVDADGISQERVVGEDKLPLELSGEPVLIKMLLSVPNGPTIPLEGGPSALAFTLAHQKDSAAAALVPGGFGGNIKFERNTRGLYPTLFQFTYADQNTLKNLAASDSTVFKLIHMPDPEAKKFPPRPPEPEDLNRKPLKPRPM